ncbi:methionyl-tRNA formyltransferase [Candidatus Kaiserbacteria bacterium]|nr:methionyl-tRNA formyltransferase [Candidatus Kaiserbacteria bacterium]
MKVSLLMDNPRSWFAPYADELEIKLRDRGHEVVRVGRAEDLPEGDCTFFLSCEQIIQPEFRARSRHNIVIHASALPRGKGWSPMTWQVLEGKNDIPISMFEAVDRVDAGDIYATATIHLDGHELIDEMRGKEGNAIVDLALRFVEEYPMQGTPQEGEESFYARRSPKDSELNPEKSIAEQFNLLRIVDNERYPAHFTLNGKTYVLKIFKKE